VTALRTQARGRTALAFALAAALLCASAPAAIAAPSAATTSSAAPTSAPTAADAAVRARQVDHAANLAFLEQLRSQLATEVAQYVGLARQMEQTQGEIARVTADIEAMDAELAQVEDAMLQRMVQLYRGDRLGLFEIMLSAQSVNDLFDRFTYVVAASRHDATLMKEVRLARQENEWLQHDLEQRVDHLQQLQMAADDQRIRIETALAEQEKRAAEIGADVVRLMAEAQATWSASGSTPQSPYSPHLLITDANYRAATSMTAAQVQAFLDQQPGALKYYRGPDYNGRVKTAAQMVAEAAIAWNVSPKVILVTLQKEQSLLSKSAPSRNAMNWAMGCGKTDSKTFYQYEGFGKQVYWGAQKLDKNAGPWYPGIRMTIDGSTVLPVNSSTYSLYKYTPHLRGTTSFWMLYWRYFGDPLGVPRS